MGLIEVASGNSVWRGMDYYKDKRVKSWKNVGEGIYDGIVFGSGDNKYVVHIDKNHPRKSTCNCPFADGRRVVCKHMIALYFTAESQAAVDFMKEVEQQEGYVCGCIISHGGEYQLLEEYFAGLSKETLHDLLCYEDKYIRELTLWIISELGEDTAKDFLEEAASQMNDDDPAIYFRSSEIVAYYGTDQYMDDFMRIFVFLEHSNAKIRKASMYRISGLTDSRIKEAYAYSVNNKILSDSHEKGLLSLIHINTRTASDITAMLNSDDSVIRKYGVMAASKVYEKYPKMIKESVNSKDLDVQDYAKTRVQAIEEIAQLHNQWRNRKRKQ